MTQMVKGALGLAGNIVVGVTTSVIKYTIFLTVIATLAVTVVVTTAYHIVK